MAQATAPLFDSTPRYEFVSTDSVPFANTGRMDSGLTRTARFADRWRAPRNDAE
jgi:hypothetical protein